MISDDFVPSKTGVGVHTRYISKELARRRHRVVVITTRRNGQPEVEDWFGVKVYRTFSVDVLGFRISLAGKSTIRSILTENDIDIIHYHYAGLLLKRSFAVAKRMRRLKHVYTYHMTVAHLTQDSRILKLFAPAMARLLVTFCNACDRVTVPSRKLLQDVKNTGVTAPLTYVSSAAGLEDLKKCEPSERAASFVILFAGRLNPEKNIPYLLGAFRLFAQTHTDSEVWLVGDGHLKERLQAICKTWGIDDQVRFLGYFDHSEMPQFHAAADVFVLPSLVETQGLAAIEAMYFGKPVIVTDRIVSATDLVEEGVNGYIVDHTSVKDLANRLACLKEDVQLRKRMGEAGKQRSEQFSTKKIVDDLENLYATLGTAG